MYNNQSFFTQGNSSRNFFARNIVVVYMILILTIMIGIIIFYFANKAKLESCLNTKENKGTFLITLMFTLLGASILYMPLGYTMGSKWGCKK